MRMLKKLRLRKVKDCVQNLKFKLIF